jgi:hypothetical protein
MSGSAALSDSGNDRIVMGGNMSAFDAHKVNVDDLFDEAQVWLAGEGVSSEAEAKAVETLLDMARDAKKAADEARKAENEPFDRGKAEVQARYNPILKRADLIVETCKNVLQPWRDKIAAEKAAKAEAMRLEAEALRREAEEKIRASAGNLAERAKAEETLAFAKDADKAVAKAVKAAATGNGLRTTYRAELTDLNAAIKHYWSTNRAEFEALVCDIAARQVRAGVREIPGFNVIEERKAV